MIIPTASGKEIDTDKLDDVSSMVFEKLDEIHQFFTKLKVPYIIRFISHTDRASGSQSTVHPTHDSALITELLIAQCVKFIEKCLPGYQVALIPREPPADKP